MEETTLWYGAPAQKWQQALPLGNGRLGAMVSGGVDVETIKLNEDSLWSGDPVDRINPDALGHLPKIRSLIREGKLKEAENMAIYALSATPQSQRAYMPLGCLYMKFDYDEKAPARAVFLWKSSTENDTPVKNYGRFLELENAVSRVSYEIGNTQYTRTHFISYPDQVFVIRLCARGEKKLNFCCFMDRFRMIERTWKQDGATIAMDGNTGSAATAFCGMLRGVVRDGSCEVIGDHLIIRDASEAVLLFAAATAFRSENPRKTCIQRLDQAKELGYERLLQRHQGDYAPIFGSFLLSLGKKRPEAGKLPTDERLRLVREGREDPGLMELYFHYGRYLLIASSRPGSLPANLQGIWNEDYDRALADSKFTININTQMNYWAAEMANMSSCHQPLFDLLERMHRTGTDTARRMYGCSGFVAHHNTDLHADTAPQDQCPTATYWVMGGAWLALHLWQHYEYTRDRAFLEKYFYILRDCVRFFNDFLIKNKDGYYVVTPTVSPENTYILADGTPGRLCEGCAMDNQILTELYSVYLKGCELIENRAKDEENVRTRAREILEGICPPMIGKYGQIMEWMEDYEEKEPGHRHISQLYGVFPGELMTFEDTPKLMEAARATLMRRLHYGGGYTGWSRAWMINLWARLRDGNMAYDNFLELLRQSTFPNLMDEHPYINPEGAAFQIDGNLGTLSGLLQCFVQNYKDRIILLSALPKAFLSGEIRGLCLKGHGSLDMQWEEGALVELSIQANEPLAASLYYRDKCREIHIVPEQPLVLKKSQIKSFFITI